MAISIPVPIVVPPTEEKVADKVWVLTMNVNADDIQKPVSAYFSVAPYVSSTGEVLRDQMKHINVDDVLTACATNPTLAQALGAIYLAVENLCKENRYFGMEPDPFAPSIVTGPISITLTEGEPLSLSVVVEGTDPISYQWRKDEVNIEGATESTYVISSLLQSDSGSYDVVVTNDIGSVTSSAGVVTVNPVSQE